MKSISKGLLEMLMRYPSLGVRGRAVWPGDKDWRHGYLKPRQ